MTTQPKPQKRHDALLAKIRAHDCRYYVLDHPTIADREHDALYVELRELETEHPELKSKASPSQRLGHELRGSLRTVPHVVPMISGRESRGDHASVKLCVMRQLLGLFPLIALVACSPGAPSKEPESAASPMARTAPVAVAHEGAACSVEPVGRGCLVLPFEGPCGAYFSANEAERQQLQDDRYLNLRFRGDHRPYLGLPPVLPRAAHRAFVTPGFSSISLVLLLQLLGAPGASEPMFPTTEVYTYVAASPEYSGYLEQLTPEAVRRLAGIADLRRVGMQWDRASRAYTPQIRYHRESGEECLSLLSQIVDVARDALQTGRAMYLVGSLARYKPACESLGGCDGYGCDPPDPTASDDSTTMCHSAQDECLQSMDCGSGANCAYDAASTRFTCRAAPPEVRK